MLFLTEIFAYIKKKQYFCTAKVLKQRKEAIMQTATTVPYDRLTVLVPRGEIRRFRTLAKEMGVRVERKSSMERAMEDSEAGRVRTYASVDEMIKAIL